MNKNARIALVIGSIAAASAVVLTGCSTGASSSPSEPAPATSASTEKPALGTGWWRSIPAPPGMKFYGASQVGATNILAYTGTGNIAQIRTRHAIALTAAGWKQTSKSGGTTTYSKGANTITVKYEQDDDDVTVEIRAT